MSAGYHYSGGSMSDDAEAALNALRRLAVARHKAEQARKAFCDAMAACSDENGMIFCMDVAVHPGTGDERNVWVYCEGRPNAGQDATDDPLWKAQNQAWRDMKAANRELGIAKAQVTRIANRIAFPFGRPK